MSCAILDGIILAVNTTHPRDAIRCLGHIHFIFVPNTTTYRRSHEIPPPGPNFKGRLLHDEEDANAPKLASLLLFSLQSNQGLNIGPWGVLSYVTLFKASAERSCFCPRETGRMKVVYFCLVDTVIYLGPRASDQPTSLQHGASAGSLNTPVVYPILSILFAK